MKTNILFAFAALFCVLSNSVSANEFDDGSEKRASKTPFLIKPDPKGFPPATAHVPQQGGWDQPDSPYVPKITDAPLRSTRSKTPTTLVKIPLNLNALAPSILAQNGN